MPKIAFLVLFLCLSACTKKNEADSGPMTADQLADRGKTIYSMNCIACHNPDPKLDGATGPSLYGSPLELIESRITSATYPAGYKPKRDTKIMPPLSHLKSEIPAIHAFLNR